MRSIPFEIWLLIIVPALLGFFRLAVDYGFRGVSWQESKDDAAFTVVIVIAIELFLCFLSIVNKMIEAFI